MAELDPTMQPISATADASIPTPQGHQIEEEQAGLIDALGRLPHRSPVRAAAQQILFGRATPSMRPFVDGLRRRGTRSWRERLVSAWGLAASAQTEEDRDAATLALADALQSRRGEDRSALVGSGVAAAALAWLAVVGLYRVVGPWLLDIGFRSYFRVSFVLLLSDLARSLHGPAYCVVPIAAGVFAARSKARHDTVRAAVARALGRLGSIDGLGPLADVYCGSSGQVQAACRDALLTVLPSLTPEHYGVLGQSSVSALSRVLRSDDAVLVAQVLRAVELIGTRVAIPELERLVAGNGPMRLRDQAAAVLDVVRAREESELHRERLLRPAGSPTDNLLRPAASAPATDPDLLLRAAVGDEEPAQP